MHRIPDIATGFCIVVTNDCLKIELPIGNLVRGFERSPNNYGMKVKRGMRKEFVEWLANNLLDDADSETGDNYIAVMLDSVFERLYEDDIGFINIKNDGENE
jgi:hypothetical protein